MTKQKQLIALAADPFCNWRGLQPVGDPVHTWINPLPEICRDFIRAVGEVTQGAVILYGGALDNLAHNRRPKDWDGHVLTSLHPMEALNKMEKWAKRRGYVVMPYQRHVRARWKSGRIRTEHGIYDLSCLQGNMSPDQLAVQLADNGDISACARAATADIAYISQRCIAGEMSDSLVVRPLLTADLRLRHPSRWFKYGIVKYPDRAIEYRDHEDTLLYQELNDNRRKFQKAYNRLSKGARQHVSFDDFDSIVPGFSNRLRAKIVAEPTG